MPELPEVQTVVTQLQKKIVDLEIQRLWTQWPKSVRPTPAEFEKRVKHAMIIGMRRFGKHIVIDLNNQQSILIHLKMTGHLLVKNPTNRLSQAFKDPYNQFIHHILHLSNDTALEFSDMRKFGWMEVVRTQDVETFSSIASLGVDAASDAFTSDVFRAILKQYSSQHIGALLLRQESIAGIGNIYRSEALHRACIRPLRRARSLTKRDVEKLAQSIRDVLREAIQKRGMSDGDFRDTDGREGEFQKELGVYGRSGKPCPICNTSIQRIKIAQRSAFFCPKCQK